MATCGPEYVRESGASTGKCVQPSSSVSAARRRRRPGRPRRGSGGWCPRPRDPRSGPPRRATQRAGRRAWLRRRAVAVGRRGLVRATTRGAFGREHRDATTARTRQAAAAPGSRTPSTARARTPARARRRDRGGRVARNDEALDAMLVRRRAGCSAYCLIETGSSCRRAVGRCRRGRRSARAAVASSAFSTVSLPMPESNTPIACSSCSASAVDALVPCRVSRRPRSIPEREAT